MLPRIYAFEIQDDPRLPSAIRDGVTDYLQFVLNRLNIYAPAIKLLSSLLERMRQSQVIDLCSGGSGPYQTLLPKITAQLQRKIRVKLTDKYPNLKAFEKTRAKLVDVVDFSEQSIDARNVPPQFEGVRTLFTSFHHFRDDDGLSILKDAQSKNQAIAIFEFTERNWLSVLLVLPAPFLMFLFMPLVWPWKASRFFWTYLIPAIPIVTFWDVMISILRTRTVEELQLMTNPLQTAQYKWEAGRERTALGFSIIYLLGIPLKDKE